MKKHLFLTLMVAFAGLWSSTALAQGTFTLFNTTQNTYNFVLLAAEDDCSNTNSSGTLAAAPATSTLFTAPAPWTGAFKALVVFDCAFGAVESPANCFGGFPQATTFVDCNGNTVGIQWVTEQVGIIF